MVDPKHDPEGELDEDQLQKATGAGIPVTSQSAGSPSNLEESTSEGDGGPAGAVVDPKIKDIHEPDPWKKKPT